MQIIIYIMDKSYEILKEYENILDILYPKDIKKYVTHYSDLENLVKDKIPSIVIIDGDSDYGIITASKIKEIDDKIKIIISSSNNKVALDAYQYNLDGFLKKPFTKETVKNIIKK